MIIGSNRKAVIKNINKAAQSEDFYKKVEINDPVLTTEQSREIVENYAKNRPTFSYKVKAFFARRLANILTLMLNRKTEIIGIEKLKGLTTGAIITSNHFSPIENTCIRKITKKLGKRRLNIVSQVTNLAMPGIVGFVMNYADTIPISDNFRYMHDSFEPILRQLLKKDEFVLIYPEQEMWFNYRKPRPAKRGPFYYAARLNVPVVSCFIEMQDLEKMDTKDFHKVKYIVHILDVLYPNKEKSVKENSVLMCETDDRLKKEMYEKVYKKPLDYTFENSDIAGWIGSLDE